MERKRSPEAEALQLLGIARRAGHVAGGTERTREALRSGRAALVLVAGDASGVQTSKIDGLLQRRGVPRKVIGDRAALGAALGAPPLSAVAVTERRLAERILRRLSEEEPAES